MTCPVCHDSNTPTLYLRNNGWHICVQVGSWHWITCKQPSQAAAVEELGQMAGVEFDDWNVVGVPGFERGQGQMRLL